MAHGVVRTDLLAGTDVRSELVSVRYQPSDVMTDIDNGNVVLLGALETGSRTVYKGATPAADSAIGDIALVASPEVIYNEHIHGLENYYNEAGKISRGYRLHEHDIFSVTGDALSAAATPKVGDTVELQADTKLKVVGSATASTTTVGKIIDINVVGNLTFYVVEVGSGLVVEDESE